MNKYTPGIVPWIALVILLGVIIHTMNKIVEYQEIMSIRLLEMEIDHIDEGMDDYEVDPWLRGWDDLSDEEKGNRLRIALTRRNL